MHPPRTSPIFVLPYLVGGSCANNSAVLACSLARGPIASQGRANVLEDAIRLEEPPEMPRSRALPIFTLRQLVSASCSSTSATLAFLVARDSLTGFFISAVYISISSTVRLSSRVSAGAHSTWT